MKEKTLAEIRKAKDKFQERLLQVVVDSVADFEEEAGMSPISIGIDFVDVSEHGDTRPKRIPTRVIVRLEDI